MCVKLFLGDLNSDFCPRHPISTYTCGVIIVQRVCNDKTVYFFNIDDA